jgi:hypothetical protein
MLATSKRLRSSSPPSSPLDQVTKRRRHTSSQQGSSSQQGPASLHEEDETDGNNGGWQQPQWVAAGPSGWRGDVPPVTQAHRPRQQAGSPWEVAADTTFYSPTGRPPAPSSYFHPNRPGQQAVPSPLGPAVQSPSYFPPFPPASAALLQQATAHGGGPSIHTPRATAGAQHDSHAHHRNAPLFHPAFVDQHPPWSSSSSASSVAAIGVHSRPPDGMGPSGAFDGGPRSQHEAITPLMGPPTLPVPADGRDDSRRASFGRPMRGGSMEADEPDDDDDDEDAEDSWDATAGTVQGNLDSLADSPYAGMNQLLHSLVRRTCRRERASVLAELTLPAPSPASASSTST